MGTHKEDSKISNARYDLEIWSNYSPDKHIDRLYKISQKDKNYDLYIKINNKYVLANKQAIKDYKNMESAKKNIQKVENKKEVVERFVLVKNIIDKRLARKDVIHGGCIWAR